MGVVAVYPGTFDPITHGHTDLVRRANVLFDTVIVAVAQRPSKSTSFSFEQRIGLVESVLKSESGVTVCGFEGLLVDFASKSGARVILRGLRAVSDFDYEFQLAGMNRKLDATLETVFLTPDDKYMCVTSSLIREIALCGGDVSPFVDESVVQAFQKLEN